MTWRSLLLQQLEFYWTTHFRPRIEGLTDDEYFWEPALGAWSLREGDDGRWELDSLPVEPPIAPVTTIAWRVGHLGRDVLGKRARAFFAPGDVGDDVVMYDDQYWPDPLPHTADGALALLDEAYQLWRDGVAGLSDEELLQKLGSRGGPYADDTMAALVLHISREVMAHGAEICLLRDLYRARHMAADPVVAAAVIGDADGVAGMLDDGATAPADLLAQAAGLRHWPVVMALVERGADPNVGVPSALHYAAAAGEVEVARALVAAGASLAVEDPQYAMTPGGWAEFFGHAELGAELGQKGS